MTNRQQHFAGSKTTPSLFSKKEKIFYICQALPRKMRALAWQKWCIGLAKKAQWIGKKSRRAHNLNIQCAQHTVCVCGIALTSKYHLRKSALPKLKLLPRACGSYLPLADLNTFLTLCTSICLIRIQQITLVWQAHQCVACVAAVVLQSRSLPHSSA